MQQYVRISHGQYGKHMINGVFPLVQGARFNKDGIYYVTVDGNYSQVPGIEPRNCRIKVKDLHQIEVVSEEVYEKFCTAKPKEEQAEAPEISDEERTEQIRERFEILNEMTSACKTGDVRAMIVSGPPGIGKTFGIVSQLQKASMFDNLKNTNKWEIVKGATSGLGLYKKLYQYSKAGSVLVFDDCDTVLYDDLSLNILKAALDSGKKRIIQWNTESRVLDREGIPDKFEFEGSVLFVTNVKFDFVKSKKLLDHLGALMSRCHYIDLTLDTVRDKMLRIKDVMTNGMLQDYKFEDGVKPADVQQEILQYMEDNRSKLRELSLRTALKIADLYAMNPGRWRAIADTTILRSVA